MHKPGINHLEIWVKSIPETMSFFAPILESIGWHKVNDHAFATDSLEIYFQENPAAIVSGSGVRHICFQATTKAQVDEVGAYLDSINADIIRGPKEMPYTKDYYTVDFRDPSGLVYEVAFTPNMVF